MNEPQPWRTLKGWLTFRPWQRHSLVLMVGGLVYVGLGITFLTMGDLSERREAALVIALNMWSINTWGFHFIFAGSLSVLSSRWPSFSDSWGYAVLCGLAAAWSGIYILGCLVGDAPYSNLVYGLVWGLVAFLWWAISGLVNPDRRLVIRDGSD